MDSSVQITSQDGFAFDAYVARPTTAPRGAVVVLQEIFGVNAHIRAVADGYAALGFLAVAPATFARVRRDVDLGYGDADRTLGSKLKAEAEALAPPGLLPDLHATVDYARGEGGRTAIVGFCWGGLLAWRAAAGIDGLSAAVVYYGGGVTVPPESERSPRVPVLAHFGKQDQHIPLATVEAFARAQPAVELHLYDAGHGFHCDQRGSFDARAAELARARTQAFLERHLGG